MSGGKGDLLRDGNASIPILPVTSEISLRVNGTGYGSTAEKLDLIVNFGLEYLHTRSKGEDE